MRTTCIEFVADGPIERGDLVALNKVTGRVRSIHNPKDDLIKALNRLEAWLRRKDANTARKAGVGQCPIR